ncbi:hypothetical protein ACOZ4I_13270 [Haloarcula salina]|uniref:hypothetical protein n=1 Tax=Haloarcula salina TaxID=1429914 RepID=UPI003C6EDBF4
MVANGLLAIGLWFGGRWLLSLAGVTNSTLGFVFSVGVLAVPIAIPTSFLLGTLLWRTLESKDDRQFYGALFGGVTALGSLAAGAFGPALLLGISNLIRGEMLLGDVVVFTALMVPVSVLVAAIAAGWLVVPLGAFGGWYHERAKARS